MSKKKPEENPFSTYALHYELKAIPGKFPLSKLAEGKPASDAVILGTLRWHPGGIRAEWTSIDGRRSVASKGGVPMPVSDLDFFQAWCLLGMQILEGGLHPDLKNIVRMPLAKIEELGLAKMDSVQDPNATVEQENQDAESDPNHR